MLNSVFKEAIQNREKTLSILKGPKYEKIIQEAKENWVEYKPQKQEVISAGIDSSFNSTKFQGAELWAVTAVSIKSDGEIIADLHDFGLDTSPELASLMDGSLYSQFMTRQASLTQLMINSIKKRGNVVFVSKTSNTRKQFEGLGAIAGDIFYYNHATSTPGFSKIFEDSKFGNDKIITSVFARLADSLPLIKVELFGSGHTDNDVIQILNKIYKNSIGGYPYSLKLAHNNCKISGNDLTKLASIHGLSNEVGSREVLG